MGVQSVLEHTGRRSVRQAARGGKGVVQPRLRARMVPWGYAQSGIAGASAEADIDFALLHLHRSRTTLDQR